MSENPNLEVPIECGMSQLRIEEEPKELTKIEKGLKFPRYKSIKIEPEKQAKFISECIIYNANRHDHAEQPICKYCKLEYNSQLIYIRCENCGKWYHGDAIGLEETDFPHLIGFKCSSCRKKAKPICPYIAKPYIICEVISDPPMLHRPDPTFITIDEDTRDGERATSSSMSMLHRPDQVVKDMKELVSTTKEQCLHMQSYMQSHFQLIATQAREMSTLLEYHDQVVNENRVLHNQIQELKGTIRVFCRVRPHTGTTVIDSIGVDGSLVVVDPFHNEASHKDRGKRVFKFDHVFGPSATQNDVFKEIQHLIKSVMDGFDVCIFAYGASGSGKSYTMSGPSEGSSNYGINSLALEDIFRLSKERKHIMIYEIGVQMIEIYQDQIRDLLPSNNSSTITLKSREGGLKNLNATLYPVTSTAHVMSLIKRGEKSRAVGSTDLNDRSSRSHSILTVRVVGKDVQDGSIRLLSYLHLVDLAGTERVERSGVDANALKEATSINRSLSALSHVISVLMENMEKKKRKVKPSHVPFRDSKLTYLLEESLGGDGKTLMFVHISPDNDSYNETIRTLELATKASTVELHAPPSKNEKSDKAEIQGLKEQLNAFEFRCANQSEEILSLKKKLSESEKKLSESEHRCANESYEVLQQKAVVLSLQQTLSESIPKAKVGVEAGTSEDTVVNYLKELNKSLTKNP